MFKLLGLGLIIAPLYQFFRYTRRKDSANANTVSRPLFQFSPKLTIVTHLSIPVLSHNGEDPSRLAQGINENSKLITREVGRQKLSRQPEEYLKSGVNGKVLRRAAALSVDSET